MKGKIILYTASVIALASIGYYFYQKRRVQELDSRVDSLEDAIKKWEETKKQNENQN
jgi:hypothetical protein